MVRITSTKVSAGARLRDQIYDFVRGEMRLGLLAPGERLKEVELAERLGVSRTPVREALFQLARDGLLEERNQGYSMPAYAPQELRERFEIRRLLEPSIARHAAVAADPRQRTTLGKLLAQETALVDNDEARRFLIANLQFKHALFDICPNKLLVRAALLYDDQFQFFRLKNFAIREVRRTTVQRHRELVAAITKRDGDGAARAMRALLDTAAEFQEGRPLTTPMAASAPRRKRRVAAVSRA
jgi:DNA-binding GntR family transcriptional regulator